MKKIILLALVTLIPILSFADEPAAVDSVAQQVVDSAMVVRQLSTPPFTPKVDPGKKDKIEYLSAIDNSEALLAEADSLSRLYDKYERESRLYMPITFYSFYIIPEPAISMPEEKPSSDLAAVEYDREWLDDALWKTWFENYHLMKIITTKPWLVPYNIRTMPEPPKQYEIKPDIKKNILVIEERKVVLPDKAPEVEIRAINWIHEFDASLQFSQAYLSENWYQGGNNNLNMIFNTIYNLKLNQARHPKHLFEMTIQYKLGVNSAPDDELRDYSINEDIFQFNAKYGLKATKKFYYSTNVQFKTQLIQNFKTNTYDLSASFLTPGELNAGVGMTYSTSNSKKRFSLNASLSPLSYNMKICRANWKMDPTTLGIDEGKHLGHEVGSSGEWKLNWGITRNIALQSRLFVFTNYQYIQGDLEATLNFSINK